VPLKLGISRNDSLYQLKYELCKKLDLNISGVYHLYHKSQPIDKKLLGFLRVFHFNKGITNLLNNPKLLCNIHDFPNYLHIKCISYLLFSAELEFWLQSDNLIDILNYDCEQLLHSNETIFKFLANRSVILLNGYKKYEPIKYDNQSIEQLIKCEKQLLESYILRDI